MNNPEIPDSIVELLLSDKVLDGLSTSAKLRAVANAVETIEKFPKLMAAIGRESTRQVVFRAKDLVSE